MCNTKAQRAYDTIHIQLTTLMCITADSLIQWCQPATMASMCIQYAAVTSINCVQAWINCTTCKNFASHTPGCAAIHHFIQCYSRSASNTAEWSLTLQPQSWADVCRVHNPFCWQCRMTINVQLVTESESVGISPTQEPIWKHVATAARIWDFMDPFCCCCCCDKLSAFLICRNLDVEHSCGRQKDRHPIAPSLSNKQSPGRGRWYLSAHSAQWHAHPHTHIDTLPQWQGEKKNIPAPTWQRVFAQCTHTFPFWSWTNE